MKRLTARQKQVLDAILEFRRQRGYPPTVREIMRSVGLRSTSTVAQHLRALVRKGYITKVPLSPRSIVAVQVEENGRSPR